MWTNEYSAETEKTPAAIWKALRDLHSGVQLSADGDMFELHGPFAVGTELSVTPAGQDTFRSRITELVENEIYSDETDFDGICLEFRHTLVRLTGGGTRITHRLVIDGPGSEEAAPELGPQISEDFPAAMAALIEAA